MPCGQQHGGTRLVQLGNEVQSAAAIGESCGAGPKQEDAGHVTIELDRNRDERLRHYRGWGELPVMPHRLEARISARVPDDHRLTGAPGLLDLGISRKVEIQVQHAGVAVIGDHATPAMFSRGEHEGATVELERISHPATDPLQDVLGAVCRHQR